MHARPAGAPPRAHGCAPHAARTSLLRAAAVRAHASPGQLSSFTAALQSPAQQREFEALWAEYARELELSKETANAIALRARQGRLVCNAGMLRERALKVLALGRQVPGLNPRVMLASSPLALRHPATRLAATARRLRALLPDRDVTATLVCVMAHLDLGAEVLACHLLELESVFCPCFLGAAPPPPLFAFYVAEQLRAGAVDGRPADEARLGRAGTGSGDWEERLGGETGTASSSGTDNSSGSGSSSSSSGVRGVHPEGQEAGEGGRGVQQEAAPGPQAAWDPGDSLDGGDGGDGDGSEGEEDAWAAEPLRPGQPPLDLAQLLVRLRGLAHVLGTDVAYAALARAPRALLGATPARVEACHAALQEVLRVSSATAARMIELRGALVDLEPGTLQPQLASLAVALGWPKARARLLCAEEPLALLRPASGTGKLWRRLERAAKPERAWSSTVSKAPVQLLATLMRLPRPDEALARMEFLSQTQAAPGEAARVPVERILRTPLGAFMREHAGYARWQGASSESS